MKYTIECSHEEFESTEFILSRNVTLNRGAIVPDQLADARLYNQRLMCNDGERVSPDNPIHSWLSDNTFAEYRSFDCLHSAVHVDPDPIPELFPALTMWYKATVYDPDVSGSFPPITNLLPQLYQSKFGPGTPQAFLYETPIIGWVMYYTIRDVTWIVEIQGNNMLRGGVLGTPTGRRHFYRWLLQDFVSRHKDTSHFILLTAEEQHRVHVAVKPQAPFPPTTPYRKDVMRWCGFDKKRLGDVSAEWKCFSPIDVVTDDAVVWYKEGGPRCA